MAVEVENPSERLTRPCEMTAPALKQQLTLAVSYTTCDQIATAMNCWLVQTRQLYDIIRVRYKDQRLLSSAILSNVLMTCTNLCLSIELTIAR